MVNGGLVFTLEELISKVSIDNLPLGAFTVTVKQNAVSIMLWVDVDNHPRFGVSETDPSRQWLSDVITVVEHSNPHASLHWILNQDWKKTADQLGHFSIGQMGSYQRKIGEKWL